ncbi:hypothetical protein FOZ62_019907 [Perkinsus olseni]|uniref:Uncharacterized protein n=1 Tax=Perkinsus olseni TaxID=32597 RepID=A0A7J6RUV5_PEROL|nr:hypothetical protein FOZ62_019907 [Perkinsus olseni]
MMIEALVKLQRAVKCYVRRMREQRRAAATRIQAWRRKVVAAREYSIRRSCVRRSVALIEAYRLGVLQRRRMRAADEDELEAVSAVNSPSLERTMLLDVTLLLLAPLCFGHAMCAGKLTNEFE